MKNTEKVLERMREVLNTNPRCQAVMEMLVEKAQQTNMSAKDFEQFKISIMTNLFIKLALDHPELNLKEYLCEDIYQELSSK